MKTPRSTSPFVAALNGEISSPKKSCKGFSLVEVVLALGIIGFAFVGVLGLLPVGLDMSRQAINATVEAQIAQQLATEALQTDFSSLPGLEQSTGSNPYYYDDQGNTVTSSGGQVPTGANYVAAFDVAMTTGLPANVSTGKLATVSIMVLNLTFSRSDALTDPLQSQDSRRQIVLIPDNGR